MAEISLESLLEVQRADYDASFSHIEHEIACDEPPSATIRLHFVRSDASGEPRFRELARLLARYITLYCVRAERRKDLPELERNEMFMQCRDLWSSMLAIVFTAGGGPRDWRVHGQVAHEPASGQVPAIRS